MKDYYNILSQAVDDIFDVAGYEDATYTPVSGDPVSCSVLVENNYDLLPSGYSSGSVDTTKIISVRLGEIEALPETGGVFTVDGNEWRITSLISGNSGERMIKCTVKQIGV